MKKRLFLVCYSAKEIVFIQRWVLTREIKRKWIKRTFSFHIECILFSRLNGTLVSISIHVSELDGISLLIVEGNRFSILIDRGRRHLNGDLKGVADNKVFRFNALDFSGIDYLYNCFLFETRSICLP